MRLFICELVWKAVKKCENEDWKFKKIRYRAYAWVFNFKLNKMNKNSVLYFL